MKTRHVIISYCTNNIFGYKKVKFKFVIVFNPLFILSSPYRELIQSVKEVAFSF